MCSEILYRTVTYKTLLELRFPRSCICCIDLQNKLDELQRKISAIICVLIFLILLKVFQAVLLLVAHDRHQFLRQKFHFQIISMMKQKQQLFCLLFPISLERQMTCHHFLNLIRRFLKEKKFFDEASEVGVMDQKQVLRKRESSNLAGNMQERYLPGHTQQKTSIDCHEKIQILRTNIEQSLLGLMLQLSFSQEAKKGVYQKREQLMR